MASRKPFRQSFDQCGSPRAGAFEVREFGALGDGKTLDTAAIVEAIGAAGAAAEGAPVLSSPGGRRTGTFELPRNPTLDLQGRCRS